MSNWRKLAWEIEGPPVLGERVLVQSRDMEFKSTGVVVNVRYNRLIGANIYYVRTDEGDELKAFEDKVRRASLWEVSRYKFQIGQQVRVPDLEGGFLATIEQAARDSHDTFYVVRDELGEPHVIDEKNIEATGKGDSNELA